MQQDPEKKEEKLMQWCLSSVAGKILEVGCGNGRLTGHLAQIADNLIALDPYLEELTSARRHVDMPAKFIAASGEWLPIGVNSIDAVVFTLSLHHQAPHKALAEACRVLKKDGLILVLEPSAESLVAKLFAVLDDESGKYKLAGKAICRSGLKVVHSGSFTTRWIFDDFNEMVSYIFVFFDMEPDIENKNIMAQLIGDRRREKPLSIEDITHYWVLRERS